MSDTSPGDDPAPVDPSTKVLEQVGGILAQGLKPGGDAEAALRLLAEVVWAYQEKRTEQAQTAEDRLPDPLA